MPGNGTHAFTEPGDYEASLCEAKIDLVVTGRGRFKAVLTWAELRQLHLLSSQEDLASIAYVELPAHLAYVAFSTRFDPPPIRGGVKLGPGDIIFHSCGELMHHCSTGLSQKGFISFTPERLAIWSYALAEEELVPPPSARIIRPSVPKSARLLYLHAEASRLVEKSPGIIAHPEVTRALEQELIHALIHCLTPDEGHAYKAFGRRSVTVMARFEEVLAAHADRPVHLPELCMEVGVSARTLRACCAEVLGMSPHRYLRLRQLKLARTALRNADPASVSVEDVARRLGFGDLRRFTVMYRATFGETPAATLQLRQPPGSEN